VTSAQPREVAPGGLQLADGEVVAADHVVTLAEIVVLPVPGMPFGRAGVVPDDVHGRVVDRGRSSR
jgi:hypothetical protein